MTTPKPRYRTDGAGSVPQQSFSRPLRKELRHLFAEEAGNSMRPSEMSTFIQRVLYEAGCAIRELHWDKYEVTGGERRAELDDLQSTFVAARSKLRAPRAGQVKGGDYVLRLSPAVDNALGLEADPLGLADEIDEFLKCVEAARVKHINGERSERPVQRRRKIAVEMAARVLPVLSEHGMKPSATANVDLGQESAAVRVLKLIGDDIGLKLEATSWRRTITAITAARREREAVLRIVAEAAASGDPLPAAVRGPRTAHSVACERGLQSSLTTKRGRVAFYRHIEDLPPARSSRAKSGGQIATSAGYTGSPRQLRNAAEAPRRGHMALLDRRSIVGSNGSPTFKERRGVEWSPARPVELATRA